MCSLWMCAGRTHNHVRVYRGQRLASGTVICHSLTYILRWDSPVDLVLTNWLGWLTSELECWPFRHSLPCPAFYVNTGVQGQALWLVLRAFSPAPTRLLTARLKLYFKAFWARTHMCTHTHVHTSCDIAMLNTMEVSFSTASKEVGLPTVFQGLQ